MSQSKTQNGSVYSRRTFLHQASMGLGAAVMLPGLATAWSWQEQEKYYQTWERMETLPEEEKLGIALVGLGNYSTGQLAPALQETKLCKLSGIVTGTPAKEGEWAQKYSIPDENIYNYETYDQIADNPDIDIIYVVLPNGMHAEYTIRAAEAGKHVICEKPMATSVEDCEKMIEACRKANRKLSIGYRLHFEPYNQEMMHLGQDEVFGPVQAIQTGNGFTIGNNPDVWRLDKELAGGGPLMDMGIYSVQGAIYTLGKLPVAVTAREETNNTNLFDEVEETLYWQMEFPDGVMADCETSYARNMSYIRARAEEGEFELAPAYGYGGIQGDPSDGRMDFPQVNQQALQMDAFADCILRDKETRVPGEMGMRDVKILMAIYEAAETGNSISLNFEGMPKAIDRR